MANDKDFVVNGPVAVGKDTKVTVGTIASGAVDLSTGNYFTDSPSGDYTYTFTNPGAVQSFQIEATGGSAAVASIFNTTIYDGNGVVGRTFNNGIDLAGDGGMVWFAQRNTNRDNTLFDTVRGTGKYVRSNTNDIEATSPTMLTAFNSNGFTVANGGTVNNGSGTYVSWSFKEQTKFFDVVTYTGTSTDQTHYQDISHNLGTAPGVVMIKRLNSAENWAVWHRSSPSNMLQLNVNDSEGGAGGRFTSSGVASMTSTTFRVYGDNQTGTSGGTYVAYLFAHDTASDGLIQCGSYTGTASSVSINLGWQPQWLLIKRSDSAEDWSIVDNVRGMGTDPLLTGLKAITANETSAEEAPAYSPIVPSSTGFTAHTGYDARYCANGGTYIYMAIRSAAAPAITWPSSIKWTQGSTPKTPAEGETDVYTFTTDDGGTTYTGIQSIDNAS